MNTQTTELAMQDTDIAALAQEARELDDDFRVGDDLRFAKGRWIKHVGDDKIEITATMSFTVDMLSYKRGWIKWVDRKPVYKLIGRPIDGFISPTRDRLGDLEQNRWPRNNKGEPNDPWQETFAVVLRDNTDDTLCTWTVTSWFGQKAIGALLNAYLRDYRNHPGHMPIVLLSSEQRATQSYGDVAAPTLKVIDWAPFGDGAAPPGTPALAPAPLPPKQEILPPAKSAGWQRDMDDEIPF